MRSPRSVRSPAPPSRPVPRLLPEAKIVLRRRYLIKNHRGAVTETIPQLFWRIATDVAQAEQLYPGPTRLAGAAQRFYESMARLEFLPNSPTLMNAGRPLQQLAACFVLPVGDSLSSILDAVKQQALIHQSGGGTGFSFSRLRPHDDLVSSTHGIASGPVSFMRIFNMATDVIKQGGTRRGANMGILRVDHPDILEFIGLKQDPAEMNNFNLSVGLTADFMRALERRRRYGLINPRTGKAARRLPAQMVFDRLAQAAWATGEPGVVYLDRINAANPTPRLGNIEATNPCVTGDTWVQTSDGPRQAQDLVGVQFVAMLNGQAYTTSHEGFFSTGTQPVFELRTVEGYTIRVTANHEILRIRAKTRYRSMTEWTKAKDLQPNDLIVLNNHGETPHWPGPHNYEEGYLLGLLLGDGVIEADKAVQSVWQKAGAGAIAVMHEGLRCATSLRHRSDFNGWQEISGRQEHRLALASPRELALSLGIQPGNKTITSQVESCSSRFCRGLLRGLFDTDGSVQGSRLKGASVRLAQSNLAFLEAVQRMLLRLGVVSCIDENRRLAGHTFPDGKGGRRAHPTLSQHELVVSGANLIRFHETIGFTDQVKATKLRTFLNLYKRRLNSARFYARVKHILPAGQEEVFDVSVPVAHAFDAGGFVVHNCGEQPLLPYESCTLGSIDVSKFVVRTGGTAAIDYARLDETISRAVRFLDNVIDRNHYPLKDIETATLRTRKIGLGIMGFADLLIALNIPYDTDAAIAQATSLMSFVQTHAHDASRQLALKRGLFPAYRGSRLQAHREQRRNATVTTIAPTGTISLIAGCSPGIEPLYGVRILRRALEDLELTMVHPAFARMIRAHGLTLEMLRSDLAASPSIQDIARIPREIRRLFVTAHDVPPQQHVRMQAVFQRFSDSGVSKTINLPSSATKADVADAFLLAYELGCKGLTVFRSGSRAAQVLSCSPAQPC